MTEDNHEKEKTQRLILGSLLESSKTTGESAKELKFVDPKGNPRYNMIYRD